VLFVHGVSVAGSSWCQLAGALPEFRCILIDRPGCGLSDPVPGGSLRDLPAVLEYADNLVPDLLNALSLDRAHVAATSYGGLFALRSAAKHPERIDRIVQYSWPMGAPMDKVPISMRFGSLPGMQAMTTKIPVTPRLVKSLLSQVGLKRAIRTGAFTDEMVAWTVTLMRETDTLANDMRASPRVVTPIKGMNRELLLTDEALARITMPVLFLWGDEDPNAGESIAADFTARLPNADLEVVAEAGHSPWIDRLDYCAEQTTEFLSRRHPHPECRHIRTESRDLNPWLRPAVPHPTALTSTTSCGPYRTAFEPPDWADLQILDCERGEASPIGTSGAGAFGNQR
jgi:pimeloyl-ACP methyl ester carboxylesterase